MSLVLVIDDEPGIRSVLHDILTDEGYSVICAADGIEGLTLLKENPVDLVILDVWLPNMGGIDVLKQIKEDYPDLEVIVISGHANIDMAVKAVKLGAFDFIEKPLSLDRLLTICRNALHLEELRKENTNLKRSLFVEDEIIGQSPGIRTVKERIRQSAASDAKVLILGDNGTGKELVAREIHRQSSRASGPFVEVNCAAIPDTLIESELFGHEKGAFTGAVSRRKGKFESADGGSLFLDEIADMSLTAQAKVLRVIQEQLFQRVGGETPFNVDVRLIAATNKDIQEEIRSGRFREDLYFRLNVVPIRVPSLRERLEDLPLLADYFLKKFATGSGVNERPRTLSGGAMQVLRDYSWPGNIRELKNFIERINIMSDEESISGETALYYLGEQQVSSAHTDLRDYLDLRLNEAKELFEKRFLETKLQECGYNISHTAGTLGIYPSNLHSKIKKYSIEIKK
ncbi:sigma-54 dependent transcriptional regulator [Marispirochaeta sp.]|jgi:two-component system, NtrC family, nitrogen regulation response regulator NtrX|uniref:sigma-54-dependent transcriptional regulator n=1 Tax=Marispirochaeta sp. TaxID=2038653 RepID=UPI0029C68B50|nr:sigma-54 dependent transcriptional regulator [Marispirochaeta sp.]